MRWLLALLLALALPWAGAQDLRAVPELSARVTDEAALLTADERAALEAKLAAFETEAGPQIAVLTVPNTAPEDIAAFAYRVASTWKIGRRDVGDGVLIIVSKDDRRVRWKAPSLTWRRGRSSTARCGPPFVRASLPRACRQRRIR